MLLLTLFFAGCNMGYNGNYTKKKVKFIFGYIKPYKMELKLKSIKKYQSFYCSLCNQLKKDYGWFSRFLLSYDITFLLIFLDFFSSDKSKKISFRCPYNISKKIESEISPQALNYSAFVNYWLTIEKLKDDYNDNKSFLKKILGGVLSKNERYTTLCNKYSYLTSSLSDKFAEIYQLEKVAKSVDDFDTLTNKFGALFVEIFNVDSIATAENKDDLEFLKKIIFQIGKWIYIMDSFEDYEHDIKKGRFNLMTLLNQSDEPLTKDEVYTYAKAMHMQIMAKINNIYKKTDIELDENIENVMLYGMSYVFGIIKTKKYKECGDEIIGTGEMLEFMD